jgi:hypothetical protein
LRVQSGSLDFAIEETDNGDIQYGQIFATRRTAKFFVPNEAV